MTMNGAHFWWLYFNEHKCYESQLFFLRIKESHDIIKKSNFLNEDK